MIKDQTGTRDQQNQQPKILEINLIEREGTIGETERKMSSGRLKDSKPNSDF